MSTSRVRAVVAAAVLAAVGAGFLAPALAEPTQVCVGLHSDRRGICVETEWLPKGASLPR